MEDKSKHEKIVKKDGGQVSQREVEKSQKKKWREWQKSNI